MAIAQFDEITKLLQYQALTAAVFDHVAGTITLSGSLFTHKWLAGDVILLAGTTGNNVEVTIVTVTDDVLTVTGLLANETSNATLNGVVYGSWKKVENYDRLSAIINTSHDCTVDVQQSFDKTNIDYQTVISVTGGTPSANLVDIVCLYTRAKVVNGGVVQTSVRAYLSGKTK